MVHLALTYSLPRHSSCTCSLFLTVSFPHSLSFCHSLTLFAPHYLTLFTGSGRHPPAALTALKSTRRTRKLSGQLCQSTGSELLKTLTQRFLTRPASCWHLCQSTGGRNCSLVQCEVRISSKLLAANLGTSSRSIVVGCLVLGFGC